MILESPKVRKVRKSESRELSLGDIIIAVSEATRITVWDIKGKSRNREFAEARQLVCFLARLLTKETLKNIGARLNRDHSSVSYGAEIWGELMSMYRRHSQIFDKCITILADE